MKIIEKLLKGKLNKEELCEDGICVTEDFIAVIDGVSSQSQFKYNDKKLGKIICDILLEAIPKLNKKLIKCIDLPKDIKEIVFCSDGYRKPFSTLEESESYLKHIKQVDPLYYKEFAYERGFYKNQENYDDRAYIRFEIL